MFGHRNRNQNEEHARRGFFSRGRHNTPQSHPANYGNDMSYNGPNGYSNTTHTSSYGPNHPNRGYYRDPYYEGSTRSDWDHYAVRHEEALIGDPLPVVNNNLNMASRYNNGPNGPMGPMGGARGPMVGSGYSDGGMGNQYNYDKRHPVPTNLDRRGNPLIGPVTANGPLAGNYSSGTVVERNLVQGIGKGRTRTGWVDDNTGGQQWGSAAWGSEPLYGSGPGMSGWGSEPLYGYRDGRDVATPLLPDNPWTHNELGRDYSDAYRYGTLPYSSVNNTFQAPPVAENFVTYGAHGERIEGTRTRVVREEIVPPGGATLGQSSTTSNTKIVKDQITPVPIRHHPQSDVIDIQRGHHGQQGVLVEDRVTPLGNGSTLVTETKTPVVVV